MAAANNAINNTVGAAISGVTNTLTVTNGSNTASSVALTNITVGGTSSGDPFLTYTVAGTTNWSEGIDNSDSDAYVLAASTALGTTNVIHATTAGEVTLPLQPAFQAYLPSQDDNVTGDGTNWQLGSVTALTERFDVNGDFNTNGTFTAPVTGKYFLSSTFYFLGLTASHTTNFMYITTSNFNYSSGDISAAARTANDALQMSCTILADMDAADTAVTVLICSNGTKVVDVGGQAQADTFFLGCLIC